MVKKHIIIQHKRIFNKTDMMLGMLIDEPEIKNRMKKHFKLDLTTLKVDKRRLENSGRKIMVIGKLYNGI